MTLTADASRKVVEKIRRKWYKKNRDKEFNIDYNPPNDAEPTRAQA